MDLCELAAASPAAQRHPWEVARVAAIRQLLQQWDAQLKPRRILDLGCGDAFVASELFAGAPQAAEVFCLDTGLTSQQLAQMRTSGLPLHFLNNEAHLGEQTFDLILLLDVLEHQSDDRAWLAQLVMRRLAPGGRLLVTVPAFQALFGPHDIYLGHYRRYRLSQLTPLAREVGLEVQRAGYLFPSLVLARWLQRAIKRYRRSPERGVSAWRRGPWLSGAVARLLAWENSAALQLGQWGVVLPGLSAFMVCQKPFG